METSTYSALLEELAPGCVAAVRFRMNLQWDKEDQRSSPIIGFLRAAAGRSTPVFPHRDHLNELTSQDGRLDYGWLMVELELTDRVAVARVVQDWRVTLRVIRDVTDHALELAGGVYDQDQALEDAASDNLAPQRLEPLLAAPGAQWDDRDHMLALRFVQEDPLDNDSRLVARLPAKGGGSVPVYPDDAYAQEMPLPGWYVVMLNVASDNSSAQARPVTDPAILFEVVVELSRFHLFRLKQGLEQD